MKFSLKYVAILTFGCALGYGAQPNLPVYFTTDCQVFGSASSPEIASDRLEYPNGPSIHFLNARSGIPCTAEEAENRLSVFVGQDPSKWRPRLPISRRVRFPSVYPGIDIVYYGNGSNLEYDFDLAPWADASRIRLGFDRNTQVKISSAGDLLVSAKGSTVVQHRPRARQGDREISANYAMDERGAQVRIELGEYDHSQRLIVDPVLGWQASFDRGAGIANAVAVDGGGNMWILSDFPGSATGFTNTFGGGGGYRDVLLFKVDPTGSKLLYAVLLGGSGVDVANGVAVANDGSAYVVGSTMSLDFPVTSQAFQTSLPSISKGAAFVVKLSPQGDSLVYSTYLGGTSGASATAIALDRDGNAFVAGTPGAPDFPLTAGSWEDHFSYYPLSTPYALQPIAGGFVAKVNTTGTALLYSTLIDETPVALTLNAAGSAYVLGGSLPFLVPLSQYTLKVGDSPGLIVTRLTPDGAHTDLTVALNCMSVIYSHAGLIALDSKNNILVANSSLCATFPGTSGAFQAQHTPVQQATNNGIGYDPRYDGLIVKIAADGSAILSATFLGGTDADQLQAIAVASDDSVLVAGGTSSSDFPVTPDALNPKYGGGALATAGLLGDGFFARLSPNLDRLIYGTWLGGPGADSLSAMALDLADNAYLGGSTNSGLESPGVFAFNGTGDMWALKAAQDSGAPPVITSVSPAALTGGSGDSPIQITGANFAPNAVLLMNGVSLPAVFSSSTQLSATAGASSLIHSGSIELRVLNPGSGASDRFLLPIVAPAGANPNPSIQNLRPNGLPAGTMGATIIVLGSGFLASTTAAVNGNSRVTSLNADNTLSVALTLDDLSTAGTLSLTAINPSPGGGVSGPASFIVSPPLVQRQPPGLTAIRPSRPGQAVNTPFTIVVSGLAASAVARWNGSDHAITFSDGIFTASAADLSHAGTAEVTIFDHATGLESNPLPVWIPFAGACSDMAWNPVNRRLYLATGNSVTVLNPDTGDAETVIPVDISINRLAVSPDGGFLFVTSLQTLRRYQILNAAPSLNMGLVNPVDISGLTVIDFAPVPGSPGSVAVYSINSFAGEIAIYDGSVKRPATVVAPFVSAGTASRGLQFSDDGKTLYYTFGYSGVTFMSMPVTSSGLGPAVTKVSANLPSDTTVPARYFQGRIYTSSGAVYDAGTMARLGAVPVSSYALPLVNASALIMLDSTSQYTCSLQAFDPVTLVPLWEEDTGSGCDDNSLYYSDLFDIGGGQIAFRMTKAYVVKKPAAAPQFSIYAPNGGLNATLELGTMWSPDNELEVLSKQAGLPGVAILLADQPGAVTLGSAYEGNRYLPFATPGAVDLEAPTMPSPGTSSTGRLALLISNTANPPVLAPYQLSFVNPYPLQASVSSLSFTWRIGDPVPAPQSFSLTKQGKPLGAFVTDLPLPSWLTYQNSDNGPPETLTFSVKPTGLTPGTYTYNVTIGYYSTPTGGVTVPLTLTVVGTGPPVISGVQDAESANITVVPGEWVAIYGANLAGTSRSWGASDFGSGSTLPTQLDGVSVQFGGIPAAVYYVSPAQLDVQVPGGISGSVPVTVSFRGASTAPFTVNVGTHEPSLFVYKAGGNVYPAATHADATVIGDPAIQPGASKARAGEVITLYVNGLGASPGGVLISTPILYSDPVTVKVGNENALVSFAGLVSPGLFQLNVQVPPDFATGNYPLVVMTGGQVSPGQVVLPVQ